MINKLAIISETGKSKSLTGQENAYVIRTRCRTSLARTRHFLPNDLGFRSSLIEAHERGWEERAHHPKEEGVFYVI